MRTPIRSGQHSLQAVRGNASELVLLIGLSYSDLIIFQP